MDAKELQQAMLLADAYAMKRARCAAYPFTTEEKEREADEACDNARTALQLFLASSITEVQVGEAVPDRCHAALMGHGKCAHFCGAAQCNAGVAIPRGGEQ